MKTLFVGLILGSLLLLGAQSGIMVPILSPVPASGGSPVAYASNGCVNVSNADTCTISGVTSGQTIYIFAAGCLSPTGLSMTDSNGIPASVQGPNSFVACGGYSGTWLVKNANSGTHILTIVPTGSAILYYLQAVVLNNASLTSPTDSASTAAFGSSSTLTTGNIITSANNEFLLAFGMTFDDSVTLVAGTSPQTMTLINGSQLDQTAEYGTAVTAGTNYATFTGSNTSGNVSYAIAVH